MKVIGEKFLVLGLGITGIASVTALEKMGADIRIMDEKIDEILSRPESDLALRDLVIRSERELREFAPEYCVKSPGIPPHNSLVRMAESAGCEVISDLELAYRLFGDRKILAITGTNGKTTTTTLVGEILKGTEAPVHIAGNIGVGMLMEFLEGGAEDYYVIECSSFQLEHTSRFAPTVAGILNITPDHLDWHGSMDAYRGAKCKILSNLTEANSYVLNIDDPILNTLSLQTVALRIPISRKGVPEGGFGIEEGKIYEFKEGIKREIIDVSTIQLLGSHNLENVLISIAMCSAIGIDYDIIRKTIQGFRGVSHRLEFVREYKGVHYYNDSKGTNVDASIKALEAVTAPILLIAGGYDKKIDFTPLFEAMEGKVKQMFLLGQTREQLAEYAERSDMKYTLVEDMDEAVRLAAAEAVEGDYVLLSPASASWGMYPNFEVRGDHFKSLVLKLGSDPLA